MMRSRANPVEKAPSVPGNDAGGFGTPEPHHDPAIFNDGLTVAAVC